MSCDSRYADRVGDVDICIYWFWYLFSGNSGTDKGVLPYLLSPLLDKSVNMKSTITSGPDSNIKSAQRPEFEVSCNRRTNKAENVNAQVSTH